MTRFENLIAEVFDAMMGTAGNNTYVFPTVGYLEFHRHEGPGRLIWCNTRACYAYFITGTGNRPEGFHKWLENRACVKG